MRTPRCRTGTVGPASFVLLITMPRIPRLIAIALLTTGAAAVALAEDTNSNPQLSLGLGGQYNAGSHSWSPDISLEVPLASRLFIGGGNGPSSSGFGMQPVALMGFGVSNFGNYLNGVFSSSLNDDNNDCSSNRNLYPYGGVGLGMQFSIGSRNPISVTTGYLATFEANRVPHGAAYVGLAYSFGGN